ncbi:hypothetical protein L1987_44237 [Smallanthus sonchifolius]|uniref:Uncharacterized protein n=1 Tax=Smallanthus sonchifolius TaxID=185202 RepID=A0ACB9GPW1_9ASTR|nr:hypothetical protein L1987_44237 [Smallanthus sonchifolius]
MATIRSNGNWVQFDSHENQCYEDEEEEALSLRDLPTNDIEIDPNSNKQDTEPEDFQFDSYHGAATCLSPENMCNADDLFFQGQLLPLRHSVSSDSDNLTRKINRSASMSIVSSRTIRSNEYGYKPKIRNQFHSHPSPSPQIRTQSFRTLSHSNPKTSSLWSFLQVGLVKPQEIGLSDLKNRSKRFGSHNSNSSSTSSSMNSTNDQNQNQNQNQHKNKMKHPRKNTTNTKKKQRLFFGGCKCSAVSIDGMIIKEAVPKKKTTKEDQNMLHLRNLQVSKESTMIGERKQTQTASRHRTFEWLKQLSIAAPSEA